MPDGIKPKTPNSIQQQEWMAVIADEAGNSEKRIQAFQALFDYFGPRLKSFLMRQGAESSNAEDIIQDVMVSVWRKAASYDPKAASVSTWIFKIALNRRIDLFRRNNKKPLSQHEPMLLPPDAILPTQKMESDQQTLLVQEALTKLPEDQKALLKKAFYEGLTHSQIAARDNIPLGTVKSRMRLAFQKLRRTLEPET